MLFNSFAFFVFLPLVALAYFVAARWSTRAARIVLLLASLVFYGFGDPKQIALLLASTWWNFFALRKIVAAAPETPLRKRWFVAALVVNLGLLAGFKYTNFALATFGALAHVAVPRVKLPLPVGISFFTLQQVMIVVDAYQGLVKRVDFERYTLFVTFFPKLLNGPIVRTKELMPALESEERPRPIASNLSLGLYLFVLGLAKKVIIADPLATAVSDGFEGLHAATLVDAWIASLAFSFQLYFDFSGYADMAIGVARMLNFELPQNFDSPFLATNVIDFWKRWHITLSRFITTYLYTPILQSFSKVTFTRAMVATLLSMAIAGLWHGPAWTFVLFGTMHGVGLVTNHLWKKTKVKLPKALAWLLTFLFVNASFVLFRARDFGAVRRVFGAMIGLHGTTLAGSLQTRLGWLTRFHVRFGVPALSSETFYKTAAGLVVCFGIVLATKNTGARAKTFRPTIARAAWVSLLLGLSVLDMSRVAKFLYFNF